MGEIFGTETINSDYWLPFRNWLARYNALRFINLNVSLFNRFRPITKYTYSTCWQIFNCFLPFEVIDSYFMVDYAIQKDQFDFQQKKKSRDACKEKKRPTERNTNEICTNSHKMKGRTGAKCVPDTMTWMIWNKTCKSFALQLFKITFTLFLFTFANFSISRHIYFTIEYTRHLFRFSFSPLSPISWTKREKQKHNIRRIRIVYVIMRKRSKVLNFF